MSTVVTTRAADTASSLSLRARQAVAWANRGVSALLVDLFVTAIAEASVLWGVAASNQSVLDGTSSGHPWAW